jgi:hypothetical protein
MKNINKITIKKALAKAKRAYGKGVRYYDKKHNTYNPASKSENILQHVSDLIGYYGIEGYDPDDDNPSHPKYSYINSGDTYTLTLVYNHDAGRYALTDIGTIIEKESNIKL